MKKIFTVLSILLLLSCKNTHQKQSNKTKLAQKVSPKRKLQNSKFKKLKLQKANKLKTAQKKLKQEQVRRKEKLMKTDIQKVVLMLKTKDRSEFWFLKEVFVKRFEEALPYLIKSIYSDNMYLKLNSINILGELGKNNIKVKNALIKALNTEKKHVVKSMMQEALGKIGFKTDDVKQVLLAGLGSRAGYERWQSAKAVRSLQLKGSKILKKLEENLNFNEYWVKYDSALTLIKLDPQNQKPFDALLKLTDEKNTVFQRVFAKHIAEIKDKRIIPILIKLLNHKRVVIRRLAAKAAGALGFNDRLIIKSLENLKKDSDYSVRKYSDNSLKTLQKLSHK